MNTVVYIDILVFVNMIVDFAVLITAQRLLKLRAKTWRVVLGAFAGALFSLLIFVDVRGFWFSLLIKLVSTATVSAIALSFGSLKAYLKNTLMTLAVSFVFSGAMICIYLLFKPPNMLIINDIVYFEIDPLILLAVTVGIYALVYFIERLFKERIKSSAVKLRFRALGKDYSCIGKIDTGCNLKEPFSQAAVIIADKSVFMIGDYPYKRVVPYSTVGGSSALFAVKAESAQIDGKPINKEIYIAEGDINNENFKAIINSEIIG